MIDDILKRDDSYNVTFTTSILPAGGVCCTIHRKGFRGVAIQGYGDTADAALANAVDQLPKEAPIPQLPGL